MATRAKELSDLGNSGHLNVHDDGTVTLEGGNVGIGTDSPARKLHIKDSGQIRLENTSTGGWAGLDIRTSVGTNDYDMYMGMLDSNGRFFIDVNSNGDDLVILQNGNIGINNTNPLQKLSINGRGNSDLNQDYYGAWFEGNTATNGDSFFAVGGWYSSSAHFEKRTGESYAHIYNYNGGHNLVLQAGSGQSGRASTTAGNVGIGTTNPSARLDVVSNSASGYVAEFRESNASNFGTIVIDSPTDGESRPSYMDYATGGTVKWSTGLAYLDTARSFHIGTGSGTSNSKVTITTGGNVGIGTNSPSEKLHVHSGTGNVPALFQSSDPLSLITFKDNNTNTDVGIGGNSNNLVFYAGSERMRIDSSGTVSIEPENGTTNSGVSGAAGGSLDLKGGTAFTGRLLFTGVNDSGTNLIGFNNESNGLVMYDYTDSQYIMRTNNDQKVSFGGGFPNVNGSSNGVYNVIVDDGICIGDGGYTHGYIGTNGTDGDVYIAANAYPANISSDRSVRIAGGSPGGGGPNEIVRYNHSHGAIRNYNSNTTTNKKWWSTTAGNFGEVEEYDYGNKLYFKKTRAVGGYSQMLLLNRYMPNQYDVSFELVSPLDTVTYRHFGIALNHVGSESFNFDYLVLRQRFGNSANNQVRIDRPAGTVGTTEGSSVPNFHDGTKRKIMIQKRASTFRMQVHELNGSVYTYGTISGISWTNSSGYFGFGIYESTGTNTWANISNLTITDVIG